MSSFLPWRGRARTNTVDLPKQAKEQISKLDGPYGPAKVGHNSGDFLHLEHANKGAGRGFGENIKSNEVYPPRNSRYGPSSSKIIKGCKNDGVNFVTQRSRATHNKSIT